MSRDVVSEMDLHTGIDPDAVVRQVAAFGLPGHDGHLRYAGHGVGPIERPLDPGAFATVLARIRHLRLSGLLQAVLAATALPVTSRQRDQVAQVHLAACATALTLERRLLEVVEILERAAIIPVVLKGASAAHLLYPDPTLRMFGDNDLLFRAEQFDRALEVLADYGYERVAASARPGFDRRFGKGATLVGRRGDELDAHRTLLFGSFGLTIDADELFASTSRFSVGGRTLLALGPDTGLVHSCYHAALGDPDPRLGSVRDVAQRFALGHHDPPRVRLLVDRWRAAPVIARAITLCADHLGVRIDDPVATSYAGHPVTRRERRAIESYVGRNRSHAAKVVASVPYIEGPGAKLAFVRANLTPVESHVRSRGSRPGLPWIGRGLRSLRRGGAP